MSDSWWRESEETRGMIAETDQMLAESREHRRRLREEVYPRLGLRYRPSSPP